MIVVCISTNQNDIIVHKRNASELIVCTGLCTKIVKLLLQCGYIFWEEKWNFSGRFNYTLHNASTIYIGDNKI